jgi:hypothetical protein
MVGVVDMKFKSKIDWWFHLTVLFVLFTSIWTFAMGIRDKEITAVVVGVSLLVIDILLVLPIYFFTYYTLLDTSLHIRCGLYNKRIAYNNITEIHETRDPSASVGLSLDRISVNCSQGKILISPKNKHEFIRLLKQRIM